MASLAYLEKRRSSRCAFLRAKMKAGRLQSFHQVSYEALDDEASRRATIEKLYRAIGVNETWAGWRDTRERQSSRRLPVASLIGHSEYAVLRSMLLRNGTAFTARLHAGLVSGNVTDGTARCNVGKRAPATRAKAAAKGAKAARRQLQLPQASEWSSEWQAPRPAGVCRDPSVLINSGGPHKPPSTLVIYNYVPVRHTIYSRSDHLYRANLWMYFVPRGKTTKHSLWYKPRRTIIFGDALDLARHISQPYEPTSSTHVSKLELMRAASAALVDFDSLIFTHHLDKAQACGVRCCAQNHSKALRRYADYRPRRAQTRYLVELVALRGFRPYQCPAHEALRRGLLAKEPCTCARKPRVGSDAVC